MRHTEFPGVRNHGGQVILTKFRIGASQIDDPPSDDLPSAIPRLSQPGIFLHGNCLTGEPVSEVTFMYQPSFVDLVNAHLCSDCEAIGDSAVRCPRCQSDALFAITRAIHRHRDSIRVVCELQVNEPMFEAA